jgi:hypothetical protein
MLLRKIIVIYSDNHKKGINTLCRQNVEIRNVKASGIHNYHCIKGLTAREQFRVNTTEIRRCAAEDYSRPQISEDRMLGLAH